jgi:hypothetical protein
MSYSAPPIKLGLNHPKNYLGYALAFAVSGSVSESNTLVEEYQIVGDFEKARHGAVELGFLETIDGKYALTERGDSLATFAEEQYGTIEAALDSLGELYRSPERFIDARPQWADELQSAVLAVSPLDRLIGGMQEILSDRVTPAAELELPMLFGELYTRNPSFARSLFLDAETREQYDSLSVESGNIESTLPDELWDPDHYFSTTIFPLKSFLWHAGVLTTKGREAVRLSRTDENYLWGLEPAFQPEITNRQPEKADDEERAADFVAPDRTQTATSRIIRNTELVDDLKEQYDYTCQVCGENRYRGEGIGYAEGHHLRPLGRPHNGPDIASNILILCPNCHADFDYGMLKLDPDSLRVQHGYDGEIDGTHLEVADDHELDVEFVEYHNREIAEL